MEAIDEFLAYIGVFTRLKGRLEMKIKQLIIALSFVLIY